jgi:hypothetical protein
MTKHEPFYADPIIAAALAKPDTDYLPQLERYNRQLAAQRAVIFDRPHRPCTCPDWAEGYGADEGEVEIDLVAMDAYLAGADRDVDVDWEAA